MRPPNNFQNILTNHIKNGKPKVSLGFIIIKAFFVSIDIYYPPDVIINANGKPQVSLGFQVKVYSRAQYKNQVKNLFAKGLMVV
jgi:hypothetical protein